MNDELRDTLIRYARKCYIAGFLRGRQRIHHEMSDTERSLFPHELLAREDFERWQVLSEPEWPNYERQE